MSVDLVQNAAQRQCARVAERNAQIVDRMIERWTRSASAAVQKAFREANLDLDLAGEVAKAGFSLREASKQLREKFKLSEQQTSAMLYPLTTGLITLDLSGEYKLVDSVMRKIAKIVPSSKSEESYLPLQRGNVPTPLGENEEAPEQEFGGVLSRVKNYRFASILAYSKYLEEDDQTGQVRDQAANCGEKMSYAEDLWYVQQLFGAYVASNVRSAGGNVPNMNVAGQAAANYGGPACTPGAVSRDSINNLIEAADYVTDLNGDFALVQVNAGLFANADKSTVRIILESEYTPSTPSASAGVVPGSFAANNLKDAFVAHYSQFIKFVNAGSLSGSGNRWGLGEAGKIGLFQERSPLSVVMEAPNSSDSLKKNQYRYFIERRFGAAGDVLPEFFLTGN